MHFRIGGTTADILTFQDDTKDDIQNVESGDFILTASLWQKLAEFAKKSNVRILFDLNSLLRNTDGSWFSSNAEHIIRFSKEHGIELDWELGNEPDLYHANFNKYVSSEQLGSDYKRLRSILDNYSYNSSKLVGPSMFDVGSNKDTRDYLKNFLSVASSSIDAVTYHQYYFNARDAKEAMFLDPATFNYFEQRTKVVTEIVGSNKKVWLGETSSGYNQGHAGMTDKFLAAFLWLDKLGLGAKLGLDVIVRQTIWGFNYPLLDVNYNPNPDWWTSILYKKLVGTKVVSIDHDGADSRPIRLYAHCSKEHDSAVVVFGVNIANSEESFSVDGFKAKGNVQVYEITAESLYSQAVKLNGEVLNLTEDLELPLLKPKQVDLSGSYTMPPRSLGFYVFYDTNVAACQ